MEYSFHSFGHPNITAKHQKTIEFTKDKDLTLKGDCIIGVKSDFDLEEIKKIIKNNKKIKILIRIGDLTAEINCEINSNFNDNKEIVLRKGDFSSRRTLGINSDKACADLKKGFTDKFRNPLTMIEVLIKTFNN